MRSYINKSGEKVTVSEEHLQTAVKIKKELQKASPSRRASLKQLVNLMEAEGFYDADSNENYRQMIKQYQKSIGELPEVAKYADMVSDGKLQSIKDLVGELSYEKRENQHYLSQINKGKRELIDFALIAEEIRKSLEKKDFSSLKLDVTPKVLVSGSKRLIVILTDMHIGALVNTDSNTYNFEVAKQRLAKLAEKVIAKAKYNKVVQIDVVNCGDVVEHSNMRYGQAFDTEFAYSDQIVEASDLIIKFISSIANEGYHVSYAGFAGNHDRASDKDKNISGDHAVKPINKIIKTFIDNSKFENIKYVQARNYSHQLLDVNGANFKFVHGDLDSFRDENLVAKHSNMDGVSYDAVIMGHYHHFRQIEVGTGEQIITFGSLKGADDYSENKLRKLSLASQGMIIVDADGEYEAKRVKLQ